MDKYEQFCRQLHGFVAINDGMPSISSWNIMLKLLGETLDTDANTAKA